MDWINTLLLIGLFIFTAKYQRERIQALDERVKSQEGLLGDVKTYVDVFKKLFDLEKLQKWVKMQEELVAFDYEKQMEQLKAEFEKKFQESKKSQEQIMQGLDTATGFIFDLLRYVPRDERKTAIDKMDDGFLKYQLTKNIDHINEIIPFYMDNRIQALFKTLRRVEVITSTEEKLTFGVDIPPDSKDNRGDGKIQNK